MKTSTDRILTTHVGSLPRPEKLESLLYKVEFGEDYDPAELDQAATEAVAEMVAQQRSWGLDIITEEEYQRRREQSERDRQVSRGKGRGRSSSQWLRGNKAKGKGKPSKRAAKGRPPKGVGVAHER